MALLDALRPLWPGFGWVALVLLLSLRLGAVFLFTPLLGGSVLPGRIRALVVLGFSCALALGQPPAVRDFAAQLSRQPGLLIQAGLTEVALGATLGLGILLAFAAFQVAGQLLDVQIGFGLARVIDPMTKARTPLLASALNQLGVVAFFLVDGHHAVMRGLAFSLERFPLGHPWPIQAALGPILQQAGSLLSLAFSLAVPVIFAILLLEMVLGVLARNLPQVNMLVLGIPLKLVAGLSALAVWMGGIAPVMSRTYASIARTWEATFVAAGEPGEVAGRADAGGRP